MARFEYRICSDLTTATHCGLVRKFPQFQFPLDDAVVTPLLCVCTKCRHEAVDAADQLNPSKISLANFSTLSSAYPGGRLIGLPA